MVSKREGLRVAEKVPDVVRLPLHYIRNTTLPIITSLWELHRYQYSIIESIVCASFVHSFLES